VARVLAIDFDDTLVVNNVCRAVLERFAAPGWGDFEREYRAGSCTVEEYNAAAIDLVEATPGEIAEFAVATAVARPGLLRMLGSAEANGWTPVVVSNGFDVYVDPVLASLGLKTLLRQCGRANRGYRWRVRYLSPRGIELREGFKLAWVRGFQAAGDFVAYAGDGASDVEAATAADAVFARSTLLERLQGTRERLFEFEDFDAVRAVLEGAGRDWGRGGVRPGGAEV
jgi:2-hydroxy-3-keto-5-methylthiopentenyl-1-phosphate phosphatase